MYRAPFCFKIMTLIDKILHYMFLLLIGPVFKLVYLGSNVEKKVTCFCIISILVLLTHIYLYRQTQNGTASLSPCSSKKTKTETFKDDLLFVCLYPVSIQEPCSLNASTVLHLISFQADSVYNQLYLCHRPGPGTALNGHFW